MKLELKNIKHHARLSEETYAYTATVYKDGKKFCEVSNHGHGGCDMQHPVAPFTRKDVAEVEDWIKANMPKVDMSKYKMEDMDQTLEGWCHEQVTNHLIEADLKRSMKTKILYLRDGQIYETKFKGQRKPLTEAEVSKIAQQVCQRYPGAKVLNTMPFDVAIAVYRAAS